jgi:putative addiction module killer protein
MFTFVMSDEFRGWLSVLSDSRAKARILSRIRNAELGNFGDYKPVGSGLYEMRIHDGPGYRLYYARHNEVVFLLILAGDKSTQSRDIRRAIAMLEKVRIDKNV